uniref:Ty3 transposon capsid-like protein domain-containing protein n=1 Tax=Chromera velia CCMP2878 TaxID=1169474 RepID=A0A0G4GM26_9ALVE|eukprot:Cvel_22470.t1-p1 / transcript=Cvel_22470.t1 / gene=Cvel_22470 / organism=Chromera_velia_CCMP2878 / gene_product=hypothetical protein / transcript_product=hypothetical protein / location=Cvel_scaffold2212:731-4406(-) / protein_length=315 / sequence_SO=supercontig / SO=protein_coding / is_pseudo=false
METTRVGRVQTLSRKAREAGFVSHAHLAAAAGAKSGEGGEGGGTSKKQLAEEAIAIEAAALEPATKKRYDAALRKMEKSNPHLLPMTSPLDVKMGFAYLKGLKEGEIGMLRGAVRWWHHEQGHGAPPLEHESLSSPAGASTDIGPGHCASKVVELPAKLVFSGKKEELQRWLKDVEDFFELNEVRESKKIKMAKGRLPAYLKEWYEMYKGEYGVFSNWESLKTELTKRLKVTMERSIARAKLQALRCTEALGMKKYNEAFSQLVGQLPHLWEEDIVEDYTKGLPNSIALDVAKAKTHTLLETQKEAAEIEAFLSS